MTSNIKLSFRQFLILLYKGFLLRKRHYVETFFEIVFPILIGSIPAIILSETSGPRLNYHVDDVDVSFSAPVWENATRYPAFNPLDADAYSESDVFFAYTPNNTVTNRLMQDAIMLWKNNNAKWKNIEIEAFESEEELEIICRDKMQKTYYLRMLGTIFYGISSSSDKLPSSLDYKIRSGYKSYLTNMKYQFRSYGSNEYKESFFLSWQAAVESTFIKRKAVESGKSIDYKLWMQRMPYLDTAKDEAFTFVTLIPSLLGYGLIFVMTNLVKRVIEEKSNGSKELFKMMGMTNFTYWISVFMNYFLVGFFIVFVLAIVYKVPLKYSSVVLPNSNFLLILILFLLLVVQILLFCLAVTTFLNKAIFGVIILIILYCVSFSLISSYIFMDATMNYLPLSTVAKMGICLLPTGALMTFCHIVGLNEISKIGNYWNTIYSFDAVPDLNLSMVMLTMILSCIIYTIIIWYVDAVWPWQYGVPKPVYFLFTKSYWCGYEQGSVKDTLLLEVDEFKNKDFFEDEPTGVTPGVVVNNLSKVFKDGFQRKVAVKNVSLNFYDGQITALLGHNGAGKTTTINMLTGLYTPSSGSASISGWDVFRQTTEARRNIGVCPQQNILYDTLTVEEHLKIYAALKGVPWHELAQENDRILNFLNLATKRTELAKSLSGGMKRKLCLGIAIIGSPKVLFLDEPTSGMDVEARRKVWDTLLDLRKDHTIILTTHYMEEADILGDRIVIMASGEIQCSGSPMFLKRKFGTGYFLHVVKAENFDKKSLMDLLSKHVPSAFESTEYEKEATFGLSNVTKSFGPLFEEIERYKTALGVSSCGITVTTMEDVFINVTNVDDAHKLSEESAVDDHQTELQLQKIYENADVTRKYNPINQFFGLFLKRVHYSKRYWSIIISQLILPFIIMFVCMYIISATSFSWSVTPLKLDISKIYGGTDGFYLSKPNEFISKLNQVYDKNSVKAQSTGDPEEFVIHYASDNLAFYLKNLIVGSSVMEISSGTLNLTAWYNGLPYHSVPLSLLLMNNALLQHATGAGTITLTNEPFPSSHAQYGLNFNPAKEAILASVFVPLALAFLSASFVLVPMQEKQTKAKLLQLMTGISSFMYWISMFAWDYILCFAICILLIIPFAAFNNIVFFSPNSEAIGTALLIMLLYGWASIPFSYVISLLFKKPNNGFSAVITFFTLIGVVVGSTLVSLSFNVPNFYDIRTVRDIMWSFRIFPSFCLSSGMSNLFRIAYSNAACESIPQRELKYLCDPSRVSPNSQVYVCCKDVCGSNCFNKTNPITLDSYGCARDIMFLAVDGVIYFILLFLLESHLARKLFHLIKKEIMKARKKISIQILVEHVEDSDVLEEEERVRNNFELGNHEDALEVINLTKHFSNFAAVDHLTFGIHKKECFGLLGVNGAGKTTTFRMLTGDCLPNEGNAYINQYSILTDVKQFQNFIGYCPQFDALIDRLSAREMITLFARLRNVPEIHITSYVDTLIKMTDLTPYADKPCMVYSGGNKRKLSIALALIGAPAMIFLDEPTAGVDPISRRKIWKILSLARRYSEAAVILTTHSMEESEALCNRLAIMVNGKFRCLGSIQQLKSKFGQGYTLIIKLKKEHSDVESVNAVKQFIGRELPDAQVKDHHQGMLQYHVGSSVTLSFIFNFMTTMKETYNLEDFLISDASLEHIFLAFARSQRIVAS